MGILTTIIQGIGKKIKDYRQQRNIRSVISKHEGILTNAFKQIIFEEGHIDTGNLVHNAEVKFVYNDRNKVTMVLITTDYFGYLENYRKNKGWKTLRKIIEGLVEFSDAVEEITIALVGNYKLQLVDELQEEINREKNK